MTPQEIFDTVATHLFAQGKQAVSDGACVYRAPDGSKCAIGCLIADEFYLSVFEGREVNDLLLLHSDELPDWFDDNCDLLDRLQSIHDRVENFDSSEQMRFSLRRAAHAYKLSPAVLDGLELQKPFGA